MTSFRDLLNVKMNMPIYQANEKTKLHIEKIHLHHMKSSVKSGTYKELLQLNKRKTGSSTEREQNIKIKNTKETH